MIKVETWRLSVFIPSWLPQVCGHYPTLAGSVRVSVFKFFRQFDTCEVRIIRLPGTRVNEDKGED